MSKDFSRSMYASEKDMFKDMQRYINELEQQRNAVLDEAIAAVYSALNEAEILLDFDFEEVINQLKAGGE